MARQFYNGNMKQRGGATMVLTRENITIYDIFFVINAVLV